jgi:hypothetical protein
MQKELLQETIDIAKVAIKSEKITPYGGLSQEMDIFFKYRLKKLVESTLEGQNRNTGKAFQHSDIL